MGWLSSSSKPEQPVSVSRQHRQKCWESRDSYFACLDKAGILKPGEEGTICAPQNADYEADCARSWIDYFNQRRILAERQKNIIEQMNAQQEPKAKS